MTSSPEINNFIDNSSVLSDRELQVIELVAAGMTNQDIAEALEISKRTVDNHVSNILKKTRTENRVALVLWAFRSFKVCIDEVNCCSLDKSPFAKQAVNQVPSEIPVQIPNKLTVPTLPIAGAGGHKGNDIQPLPLDTELCA